MQAKRSDRAKLRGFDARKVERELTDFVTSETDVIAFPPMGDWGLKSVQQVGGLSQEKTVRHARGLNLACHIVAYRWQGVELSLSQCCVQMATCYGLRSSVCGGAKKKFVMVRTTPHATVPEGKQLETLKIIIERCGELS